MNINLIFTYGVSLKDWKLSGILDRELEIYRRMVVNYGYEINLITFGDNEDENILFDEKNINIYPVYKYIKKTKSSILNFIFSFFIPFKLKRELKDTDLIKTNQLNGSWIGIILKYILKKPLIVRTGYNVYEFSKNEGKSKIKQLFYFLLTKYSIIFSDKYFVSSESDLNFLIKNFKNTENIVLFPNWVDSLRYQDFKDRHSNKILSVGRLEDQKNYQFLIKKLSKSNIEIDIVGEGNKKEELKKLAMEYQVKINFLGKMNFFELQEIYKNYRVFVMPSLYEGNPKALLEALASGCLVAALRNKNISEIIIHKKNGIIFNTKTDLSKELKKCLSSESVFNELTEEGYSYIKKNNLIDLLLEKEIEVHQNL
tara:strand:+ start:45 stop:1154 length:1110 start_codon:yes stop_codon:yes gene_type:complete